MYISHCNGMKSVAICTTINQVWIFQLWSSSQKILWHLFSETPRGPPSWALNLVHAWSSWYMAKAIAIKFISSKRILMPDLEMNLWPTCKFIISKIFMYISRTLNFHIYALQYCQYWIFLKVKNPRHALPQGSEFTPHHLLYILNMMHQHIEHNTYIVQVSQCISLKREQKNFFPTLQALGSVVDVYRVGPVGCVMLLWVVHLCLSFSKPC